MHTNQAGIKWQMYKSEQLDVLNYHNRCKKRFQGTKNGYHGDTLKTFHCTNTEH